MAVAHSIFTLGRQVQLFWTAFDQIFAVVPLKVALGWHTFGFWVLQKNNQASECPGPILYFCEMHFFPITCQLLMVPL